MGDAERTKARLTRWGRFHDSLTANIEALRAFSKYRLLDMSDTDYSSAITKLRPHYAALDLLESGATVVVNSKAFHHLFPEFIPPIDRQHTIRFFRQEPEDWLDSKGKFKGPSAPGWARRSV